ncbi:MAG: amidoligase family protein [Pseudomonadota bacterium]
MSNAATPKPADIPANTVLAPPVPLNAAGVKRQVGVELEFGGIDAITAATTLAEALPGTLITQSSHQFTIEAEAGSFRVELDARWSHPGFVKTHLDELPETLLERLGDALGAGIETRIAEAVGAVAGIVMPVEVVAPPIPWDRLETLTPITEALARAGALGTRHSALAGFGMHLNIEVVSLAPDYLLSVLRAYVILATSLRRKSRLDPVRYVQSYIDPFPLAYARHILQPGYRPDAEQLIRDHIAFNPSRNYELDMLPIFAAIDADLVAELLPGEKNAGRPTFHWRLPDCRLDEPGWDLRQDWARWVAVERLAADPGLLAEEGERFLLTGPMTEAEARVNRLLGAITGDAQPGERRARPQETPPARRPVAKRLADAPEQPSKVTEPPRGTVTLQTIAMPADTNANGDIFGGWLMAQMDLGASVLARGRARGRVATVAVESMTFLKPVRVGDVVSIHADMQREGRSSMRIGIEVWITRQPSGSRIKVTEATFTFVAISEDGQSRPLP